MRLSPLDPLIYVSWAGMAFAHVKTPHLVCVTR
jgi:hypothetical protein